MFKKLLAKLKLEKAEKGAASSAEVIEMETTYGAHK